MTHRLRTRLLGTLVGALALGAGVAACGGSSDVTNAKGTSGGSGSSAQLGLVAYSTPKKAYDALTAAFEKTAAGKNVTFTESFAASGAQSRAVAAGQPADVVAFSTEPDVARLVKAGLVSSNWDANQYKGIVADSLVVMVVRKGNPKHITGWSDLLKPGIDVVTPNPSTSGSARWNILAAYGAQLKLGKSPAQALAYVRTLITKHVSVEDPSGSTAMQTFAGGKGDVLLSYESEAIAAEKAGLPVQYVIPRQTILIQTPDAVVNKSSHPKQAQAFLSWLWSPTAQTIWANEGFRPVVQSVASQFASKYPTPAQLFTIDSLGGWKTVDKTLFDPANGSVTKVEQAAGFPTSSK